MCFTIEGVLNVKANECSKVKNRALAQIAFDASQNQMTSFKEIESMMEAAYNLY